MKAHDVPRVHRSRPLAVPTAQDVFHFCTVVQQCAHVLLFLSSGCNSTSEWCSPQPRSKPHLALDSWRACEAHTKRKATNTDIFWEYETLRNIRRLKPAVLHMLHMLYRVGASENSSLAYWQTGPPNISRSKENAACQRLAAAPEKTANFSSCFPGVFLLEASCSPFKANR